MSGGSKLDGVIAHSVPSYQPAFRLYGSGTVQRCVSDDTSITGSNTLMAVLGSNSGTTTYRGDIYTLSDDTVDFEFIDCKALNFGFAAVVLLGKWSKFNWVGGGFDRSARTDAYSGLIISTRGPIRDGLMIEFDPLYITPGTGVISNNDFLGMNFQGFYSKLITLDKHMSDYNNGIIDKSRLVPVISVNGTTQKPLVISQTAATNLIDATYNAGNLSSRFHIERVKRTDVASIYVSASQTTIDVTGFSRIKLTGTNPSDSVSKVTFVNRELHTLEYTEEGYPILAKFNATVNNGTVGVAGNILNVTNVSSGQLSIGMRVKIPSTGISPTILSFGTGTGGVGTYFININLSLVGTIEEWIGYHPYGNDVGRNGELYIEFANTNVKLVHSTSGFGTFRLTAGVDYTPPYAGMVLRFLWSETLQQFIQA